MIFRDQIDRLASVLCPQFLINIFQMIFYCIFRNTESLCDLRVLFSLCQKMQHISFVAAEAVDLHELSLLQVRSEEHTSELQSR